MPKRFDFECFDYRESPVNRSQAAASFHMLIQTFSLAAVLYSFYLRRVCLVSCFANVRSSAPRLFNTSKPDERRKLETLAGYATLDTEDKQGDSA